MLKLHQSFFFNFLAIFIGALLISSFFIYFNIKKTAIHEHTLHLKDQITLLEMQIPHITNLDKFAKEIHNKTGSRVTIINDKGLVLAESNKDKTTMDNHRGRAEVMDAAVNEFGVITRYSNTLNVDFVYVAKRIIYQNEPVFLRLSVSLNMLLEDFYSLWYRLTFVFVISIIIGLYLAYKISKKIRYDLQEITHYLREVSDKNYRAVIKPEHFSEFLYIAVILKNLAKKLNNRDKQKRKYTARLRLINKQRNDILSAIGHEFKNPVASIQGYAETLIDDPDTDLKIRKRFLEKILQNSKKITSMLERISLSVKLENEDLKPSLKEFDLMELTQEIIMNLSKKYKDRQIKFSGENYLINADKTMIETVIINLIDNAMKYSQDDVTVSITDDKLMVHDKGMGIAEKEIDKITSKFYRVQKNTWDNSMGLGLAIVSYVLKLHGLELIIDSKENEGSTFGFNLKPIQK